MDGNGETLQAQINRVRDLYDLGLFAQAWEVARHLGDSRNWPHAADQVLGGRLYTQTGDFKTGRQMVLRAWRRSPADHEAQHHVLWQVQERRGSYAALRKLRSWWRDDSAPSAMRADQESMAADFLGRLRDFARAHRHLDNSLHLAPDVAWAYVTRSRVFAAEDRSEDALAAARDAMAIRPHYWAAACQAADALIDMGRDDDALSVLGESVVNQESFGVAVNLITLQIELGDFADAARTLARLKDVAPNLSGANLDWWHARMADVAYFTGDREQAAHWAEQLEGNDFFAIFATTLRSPEAASMRRVQLPLPFIRQHHLTCVPATLTSICRFWNMAADHVEIADEICYDGTSNHSERAWAERNGCVTREFRVTWEVTRALIDRGVPFTLSTKHPGGGHLQAVTGYDELRRTLLIRDPTYRSKQEFSIKDLLEGQASSGPRGHAFVPLDSAHLLDDMELPDAELFDHHHQMQVALEKHCRLDAEASLAALREADAAHRLTLLARRSMAQYDQNKARDLAAIEELLKAYPDDVNLQLSRISAQRGLARREDMMRDLRAVCESENSHPMIWVELASELRQDARQHDEALRWLKRTARIMASASAFYQGAHIVWDRRQHDHALELYRIAACLDDKTESYADSYFKAARNLRLVEDGLAFLRERVGRQRKRSSLPSQTLMFSLDSLERRAEARRVMAEALRDRPDDGGIKLVAMRQYLGDRDFAQAERLLEEARPHINQVAISSAAARIAERKGETQLALDDWLRVAEARPFDMEARRAVTRLMEQTHGRAAALEMLAEICRRFPHHYPLKQLHVEWLRDEPGEVEEAELRLLVLIDPDDAWTRRELALVLNSLGRGAEALEEARLGVQLEPHSSASYVVLGDVLKNLGRLDESRAAYHAAMHISVDNVGAMRGLLGACDSIEHRRFAVTAIRTEVARQNTFGSAIESFADIARPYLSESELLDFAREAHTARPDLTESWFALVLQLLACHHTDEALKVAREAVARFPHIPAGQIDIARVHQARLDVEGRIDHLRLACEMNPSWGWASRELADALLDQQRKGEALEVMERAVHHAALDPWNHYWLGITRWRNGDKNGAIEAARSAILLEPGLDSAWNSLAQWGRIVGRPHVARACAVELTRRRPGEARSWRVLAELLIGLDDVNEKVAALQKAASLSPRVPAHWHALAIALVDLRRWDEALSACAPDVFDGQPPASLHMRRAWVLRARKDPSATVQMEAALHDDPSVVWAWKELAEWQMDDKQFNAARRSAEMIARLQPFDHIPLGILADIKIAQRDFVGAKSDLGRALQLDPSYGFAAFTLFRLHSNAGEWQPAAAVLDRAAPHHRAHVLARRWVLHADTGEKRNAIAALTDLFACDDDTPSAFNFLFDALNDRQNWRSRVERAASKALKNAPANCNPNAGWAWIRLRVQRSAWKNNRIIRRMPPDSELATRAFCEQMDGISPVLEAMRRRAAFLRWRLLRSVNCLIKSCPWALDRDQCWGKIGYALLTLDSPRHVVRWLSDWRERKSTEPWMLQNLIASFHRRGMMRRAREVIDHVLALPYRDDLTSRIERYEALHRFHEGDCSRLRRTASGGLNEKLDAYDQRLHDFITLMADFSDIPPARALFDDHSKGVLKKCWATFRRDRCMSIFFDDGVRMIGGRTGSISPRLWSAFIRVCRAARMHPFVTAIGIYGASVLSVQALPINNDNVRAIAGLSCLAAAFFGTRFLTSRSP